MSFTKTIPNIPLEKAKHTKIIATVGPATNSYEAILALIKAGANGIRLNFSHGTEEERSQQIAWIRKASHEYGKPIAIIQDLQGPKIRLGDFDGVINVQQGNLLSFAYNADHERSKLIPTQYDLSKKVKRGERLYIFDGRIKTIVTKVSDGIVYARAENDGILIKRKGINLPDTDFEGDVITLKDRKDIAFGSEHDIDYVAQSFIQTAADVEKLRKILNSLGSQAKIIAKIETKAAVENLDEIMEAADAVMVARGDLAIETSAESVPVVQRKIIGLGLLHRTPTIVATQMLASMTESPEPTRAEVSDVATAIIVGADAVMLSDETANGRYPTESVGVMKRVILYTEENSPVKAKFNTDEYYSNTRPNAIADAIIKLAHDVGARAIVAETKSGATAITISARRSDVPIIAVTSETRSAQQLAIVYGVKSFVRPVDQYAATKLANWLLQKHVLKKGDFIVTASGKHPGVVGSTDTIKIRML